MPDFLKDYEPVEDRLRAFWSDHPDGRVVTVLVEAIDGRYIVRAEVFRSGDEWPAASGLAQDSVEQLPPTMKASALEVAETSAVGRALANLGYSPKGRRPSREEMSKASPVAAGKTNEAPGLDPGDTTSADGEAAAKGPAEAKTENQISSAGSTKDAPGPPHYPLDPADCDHLGKSGHRLPPRKSPRGPVCPRCGLSYVTIVES